MENGEASKYLCTHKRGGSSLLSASGFLKAPGGVSRKIQHGRLLEREGILAEDFVFVSHGLRYKLLLNNYKTQSLLQDLWNEDSFRSVAGFEPATGVYAHIAQNIFPNVNSIH